MDTSEILSPTEYYHRYFRVLEETKSYSTAIVWLKKAAEQGLCEAQRTYSHLLNYLSMHLWEIMHDGEIDRELKKYYEIESEKWLKKAAENGLCEAQYEYGAIFIQHEAQYDHETQNHDADEHVIKPDNTEVVQWFKKASKQNLSLIHI